MTQDVLEGRVAVVTGASRGIGRFIAEFLASRGASLAICARTDSDLEVTRERVVREFEVEVITSCLDVRDRSMLAEFAEQVEASIGIPDILVNNAGLLGPVGPLDRIPLDQWEYAFNVNVVGAVNTTSAFLPGMIRRRSGTVVNLSGAGVGGPRPLPRIGAYSSSKAALVSLTEAWALELGPHGINVNAVAPGGVDTGFMDPVLDAGSDVAGPELHESMANLEPATAATLDRFGQLLLYLASPRGAWLTGRLLSARWETAERLEATRSMIEGSSLFTLRRIDDVLFTSMPPEGGT